MKIVIPIQVVPDSVEEIIINDGENGFDLEEIAWIINEFDDHAIEQGIILKEKIEAEVVVAAVGGEFADDGLFTAAAKGADRLIRINVDLASDEINNHALARIFKTLIEEEQPDLILTGVSNYNGFDGAMGALLAEYLGMPYVGYVSGIDVEGASASILKDYPGGVKMKYKAELPVVIGISSSENPPRYVPISKIRQAMKISSVEDQDGDLDLSGGLNINRMYEPEKGGRAEMLSGDLKDIADRIVEIIKTWGVI
jgi:electron transfer flavoprotein beta subunit